MVKLYQLSDELRELQRFMESEDVDADSFSEALDSIQEQRDAKIANIGLLVKELRASIEARKETARSLQSKNKSDEKRIEWLISYVNKHIDETVKTPLVSVSKREGSLRLVVEEDAQIPETYYRREVDKTALRKAVTDGEEYHGVRMERGEDSVVIR